MALSLPKLRAGSFHCARAALRLAGPVIPLPLGKAPYSIAFRGLSAAIGLRFGELGPRLWVRNSFLTEAFVPGVSDLDLTLRLERVPARSEAQALVSTLKTARSAFPWLGEANVYAAGDLGLVARSINPHELARDPRLTSELPGASRDATRADAAVFLLRALDSDVENLRSSPAARLPKWRSHFKSLGLPLPEANPSSLLRDVLSAIVRLVGGNDATLKALRSHLDAAEADRKRPDFALPRRLHVLYPHRYALMPTPVELSELDREIMLGQAAWETAGLLSQYLISSGLPVIPEHSERVARLLGDHGETSGVSAGLRQLAQRAREFHAGA